MTQDMMRKVNGPSLADEGTRTIEEEIIARSVTNFEPMPMLEVIYSKVTTSLAAMLKARIGLIADIQLGSITYETWAEVTGGVGEYAICAIASAQPWDGYVSVIMNQQFFFSALEMQLGGNAKSITVPARQLSAIESRIAAQLVDIVLEELAENFARVIKATFKRLSVETLSQHVALIDDVEPCAVVRLIVKVGETEGVITVSMPLSTLAPVQNLLTRVFFGEKMGVDQGWKDHLSENISASTVELKAVLAEVPQSMADILNWKVGDTIPLDVDEDQNVAVYCDAQAILFGPMGHRKNGNIAIKVDRKRNTEQSVADHLVTKRAGT